MNWFLLSLLGPLLYAITNHIDKILLEKYFRDCGVGTLILFSSLLSALALPILFAVDSSVLDVSLSSIAQLFCVGVLNLLVLWAYLMALKNDEATIIIIFYQLVPVFASLLGYWFLDEKLSTSQIGAMLVVIVGTSLVSVDFEDGGGIVFRKQTVLYMLLATLTWAAEATLFKSVALEENVWRSAFWEHVSLAVFGFMITLIATRTRRNFFAVWRTNKTKVLLLNGTNEVLFMTGSITVSYALMLAPIALVLLSESFQPVFVFILGASFSYLFPEFYNEKTSPRALIQKALAIILTGIGAYWLVSSTH